eukprot:TRINITY_DN12648_c1_g1_i1.p1 TRINITY_DN12648_c1_g1~~TRINITY_DN12648_c1_g1_i1.p1  ORF type:complete len:831 (+),score=68.78 TRINITY_DN12648_c1_g1_i1:43-2535(+)
MYYGSVLICLFICHATCANGIGFCLNEVPVELKRTGFSAVSALDEAKCKRSYGPTAWCPLNNRTDDYVVDGKTIVYYWYSACCNGRQGDNLIIDKIEGRPTCRSDMSRTECTKSHWAQKLLRDLGIGFGGEPGQYPRDHKYFYDPTVIPPSLTDVMDDTIYGGSTRIPDCICSPSSPKCLNVSADGSQCLLCTGMTEKCSDFQVQMSIHFFKLHTIDLKSSLLSLQTWIRQIWTDLRLSFDFQCYGGLDAVEIQVEAGSLENSRAWVPDIELYNSEESIWTGLGARRLILYSCWDGKPSRGGCGYVWWSRPGVIKALCKYTGLVLFPRDTLKCELEFSGWAVHGKTQDIIPRIKDGGYNFPGRTDFKSMAGITGGSSFQDYALTNISVRRDVLLYDCCADQPWPALVYTVEMSRSTTFYETKLFIPAITIAALAFMPFWMSPECGERLAFGVTIILAVVMNDVTASALMPVCKERLLMDYVSLVCFLFSVIGLLESCLIVCLYHRSEATLYQAVVPHVVHDFFRSLGHATCGYEYPKKRVPALTFGESKLALRRAQLYRFIFIALDRNCTGKVESFELDVFRQVSVGKDEMEEAVKDFTTQFRLSNENRFTFSEFMYFSENHLGLSACDVHQLEHLVHDFVHSIDRMHIGFQEGWKRWSRMVDMLAKFTLPPAYILSLATVFSQSEQDLTSIMSPSSLWEQATLVFFGFFPVVIVLCVYAASYAIWKWCDRKRQKQDQNSRNSEHHIDGMGSISSMRLTQMRTEQASGTPSPILFDGLIDSKLSQSRIDQARANYGSDTRTSMRFVDSSDFFFDPSEWTLAESNEPSVFL